MLTLFYSPHATSFDNEAGRASGHADPALSEKGLERAHELGQHYAAQHIDAIYCSDLQRAQTTAQIAFSPRGLLITADKRLRECDYGQLTQIHPDNIHLEDHVTEPYPDGESLMMVAERVGQFLREAMRDHDGQTLVVIAHRATKYGFDYWSGHASMESIVQAPWEWRDVPIWRYEFNTPLRTK